MTTSLGGADCHQDLVAFSAKFFSECGNVNVGRNVFCTYWDNSSATWADGAVLPSNRFRGVWFGAGLFDCHNATLMISADQL
jgi:hypothetical protein